MANMKHEHPRMGKGLDHTHILILLHCINVVLSLTCHRAEYQIGQECCLMCPTGTHVNKHCTEFRSTSCLPCEGGMYMDEPTGRTECLPCRSCDSGSALRVKSFCTSISDTGCEAQEGHYCKKYEENSCVYAQKHILCEPGYHISQPGSASTDTVCSKCSEGTFSNGTLTSCQPHTQCELLNKYTVKAGTSEYDGECAENDSDIVTAVAVSVTVTVLLIIAVALIFLIKKT